MPKMAMGQKCPSRDYNHSSFYKDLIKTNDYLKMLRANQSKMASHFDMWQEHRNSTIDTVDSLQKKIDSVHVGCNAARGVAAATGIAGVAAWILGAFLQMKGHKSAAQFIRASQYCAGASTATIASSKLLEFGLTQSYMNEVERVIKRDVELTQPMKEWIKCSQKVESLFYRMFQCNILSSAFAIIMKVFGYCIEMLNAGLADVEDLIRDLQSCKKGDMEDLIFDASQKVLAFLRSVQKNPKLLTPMKAICKIFEEDPNFFEFLKSATDVYWTGFQMINSGVLSLASIGCPDVGFNVIGCVLNAVAIASHVVTFKNAVQNVQEGKSKYSESLDKIKTALILELEEVTNKMNK